MSEHVGPHFIGEFDSKPRSRTCPACNPPTHAFRRGGCMSRCFCGKTFSDPIHGPQSENVSRLRNLLGHKP